jgi:hypothetical protein
MSINVHNIPTIVGGFQIISGSLMISAQLSCSSSLLVLLGEASMAFDRRWATDAVRGPDLIGCVAAAWEKPIGGLWLCNPRINGVWSW